MFGLNRRIMWSSQRIQLWKSISAFQKFIVYLFSDICHESREMNMVKNSRLDTLNLFFILMDFSSDTQLKHDVVYDNRESRQLLQSAKLFFAYSPNRLGNVLWKAPFHRAISCSLFSSPIGIVFKYQQYWDEPCQSCDILLQFAVHK